jgi:ABC-2 type transport system ATP-binding protein
VPERDTDPAVEVHDLVVRYGELTAVDGLSLAAWPDEVLALLGPNGAGKTSTVETLEGYRRPAAGTVRVLGLDPIAGHRELVRVIGVMPQGTGLMPGMRATEAVGLFAAYYDDPTDPDELLERVGLATRARSTWRQLSGGEQQRLSLALALVGRPRVAFLDEPTAGVDVAGRMLVREVVDDLRADSVCVLLTTHELEEAERMADRVAIIDRGRLLALGTPAELVAAQASDQLRFSAPPGLDTAGLGAVLGGEVTETEPGSYVAALQPEPRAIAALTAWLAEQDLPLGDLRARDRLEDVFVRLTEESSSATRGPEPSGRRRHRR